MVTLYVLAAAWGICQGLQPDNGIFALVFPVAIASAITFWCVVDSQITGRPIITSLHFLIFITWPVAVPVYLIWSRRLRGFVLALVHGLGLCVVFGVLFSLPGYVAYRFASDGCVALENGDYDRAVRLLHGAVVLRNDDGASWSNLGAALEAKGRMAEAVEAFEKALRLDGSLSECRDALFRCKSRLAYDAQAGGDPSRAIALYREALAIDDSEPDVWYNLGLAHDALGDVALAVDALEKACSLESENEDYRRCLAFLRRKLERPGDQK